MIRRSFSFLFSVFACLILCASFTAAQETTGSIEGFVKDAAGAVVPNITLTITTAKGVVSGTLDTGLNAVPFVGALKNIAEVMRGRDFFPDRYGTSAAAATARTGRRSVR